MFRYLFVGLLLVAVVVGAYVGCGPRAAVAGKKVLDQIDAVLGKLNVQLEKVEQAHASLTTETENMREKRIAAEVRLGKLEEEREELEAKVVSYKRDLTRLREYLKAASDSGTADVNGKKVDKETLTTLSNSTVKKLKAAQSVIDNRNKTLTEAYRKSLSVLKNNETISKKQLIKLDDQIAEIKAKKSALDAMKEASSITGAESSISDKFDALTKDVDELLTTVDIKLETEESKVDERMAKEAEDLSIDDILGEDSDVDNALSEIDAILGGEGN